MSIMDSWSERVGDDLRDAKRDAHLHRAVCSACRTFHPCDKAKELNVALAEAKRAFDAFINCGEI
jgi:hypothetical protein